jgi:16S rRNA (adenine1518-N6/adenine1519-N6)-dimethyltransferase
MLRQSLRTLIADPLPLLEAAGVAPELRAEQLDVATFARLARIAERLGSSGR